MRPNETSSLALDLEYITKEIFDAVALDIKEISRMISGLKKNYDLKS